MNLIRTAFLLAASAALTSAAQPGRQHGGRQVVLGNADEDALRKAYSELYGKGGDAAVEADVMGAEHVYVDDEETDIFESAWRYRDDDDEEMPRVIWFDDEEEEGGYPDEGHFDCGCGGGHEGVDDDAVLPGPPGPPGKFSWSGGREPVPPPPPSHPPREPGEPGKGERRRPGHPGQPGAPGSRPGRPGHGRDHLHPPPGHGRDHYCPPPGHGREHYPPPRHGHCPPPGHGLPPLHRSHPEEPRRSYPGHGREPRCPPPGHGHDGHSHSFPGETPPFWRHLPSFPPPPPFFGGGGPGGRHPMPPRFPHPPGHPHHPIYTNLTIYDMLSTSKYTTKLFALVKQDAELTELLNSTSSNITFFAPTDKAFDQLPHPPPHNTSDEVTIAWDHKELVKALLRYHVSPEAYDSRRLFVAKTIPSGLKSTAMNGEPQRIRVHGGLFGIRINFLAKVIAADVHGTNGIVHGLDNFIFLPPNALTLLDLLPTEFSTTAYALSKTGVSSLVPSDAKTLFAPSNRAWRSLGLKINAFLFSKFGERHLAALMRYHVALGKVVFSDYVYEVPPQAAKAEAEHAAGRFHVTLKTMLGDRTVDADVLSGPHWVRWALNGRTPVFIHDIIARDGVIQVPAKVLIPPMPGKPQPEPEAKPTPEPFSMLDEEEFTGDQVEDGETEAKMTVEELRRRLEPYM